MGRDLEEIVAELMSRLPHCRDDPYCRGVWERGHDGDRSLRPGAVLQVAPGES
jgi:hypothetical protein